MNFKSNHLVKNLSLCDLAFNCSTLYTIKEKKKRLQQNGCRGERGGVQPFGYNKRRSICRSTVVSESDPRANGTRCFGLLTSADTGKAASILRSHGANALALANALTEGRSIQTN
ncbi:hypothetical protein T05_630 [Trichinella murrelli]|uniref:Uncharacterized protein n=1 Tax=Trichinella murrelli TaxID=144512 RepID=A0A0V0TUU1_9BILA|nr:hypothetical protein T05_630 [Trichinella murrelli]